MKTKIEVSKKAVLSKNSTKSITVVQNKLGINVVHFKSPTSLVGKDIATEHYLSEDELIKHTLIGMSDDAIVQLSNALTLYITEVLGVEQKSN